MENEKEYIAFISYQRKDEEWAEWLQHQLEHYRLPSNIIEEHPELPREVRPLFRDATELAGGVLAKEINAALENSHYLIVICSPNSAKSIWVDKEVQTFINLGKLEFIIPFIVQGVPYAQSEEECFVPALVNLRGKDNELLGISVSEIGREVASIKVVARMLNLKFDSLWQRYEKEKEEERLRLIETNNKILRAQARFVAEKANDLTDEGNSCFAQRILLEVLPEDEIHPDRPYTVEAEKAFRKAVNRNTATFRHNYRVLTAVFSPNGKHIVSASGETIVIREEAGLELIRLLGHTSEIKHVEFSPDGKHIVSASNDRTVRIWDVETGLEIMRFEGHTDYISSASFSPDGKRIVSASGDKTIGIWDFPPLQDLIDQTRERFKDRPLTPEERRQYYLE